MAVSIQSMRYFTTALAHGSISAAAEELNVAASAVSAAIDRIEAHFQLTLVNRFRSRGISATASGQVLDKKFIHLLEEFEAVMSSGSDLQGALTGALRIGYYAPVAPAFLPDILADLAHGDGQVTLHLEECDNNRAQEGFLAGDFDAILFVSDAALPQITFDVLIEAPAYCLTACNHQLAKRDFVHLTDLAEETMIVLNRPLAVDYYRQLFHKAGHNPDKIAYANSTEMVRSLVGAGHGCAVLNMLPATDVSYSGDRLVAKPIKDSLPPLTLAIGYDKANPRRIVSHFVTRCLSYFGEGEGRRLIVDPQAISAPPKGGSA
ncbi:LysR family transcriptional regulator [Ruegeria pomeroyi]|nr:LysR family transcriptional regulator [Ruegeria pomeroyi]MCE8553429.1 LysR family transcriptional regulator [Ruegeria pomeroyi]